MTRGSSINFKKSSAGFEHNDRTEKREPKHLLPEEFRQKNECDRSAIEAKTLLAEMVENAKKEYQARTGQKCQAKILSVEAVINVERHHTLDDVKKINEYLEQKHGFRAVQSSIHRDEGHINEDGKPEYNLHAHVVYCNLDKEGKTILKGLEKADLRDLQSFVAEALEMTRGQSADITNAKHKTPQEWRYDKVLERNQELKKALQKSEKSLNLYKNGNQMLSGENEELRIERKTLKEELQALKEQKAIERATLQENNALRADYAQMEAKFKALEAEIREQAKSPQVQKSKEMISEALKDIDEIKPIRPNLGDKELVKKDVNGREIDPIDELVKASYDTIEDKGLFTTTTKKVFNADLFIKKVKERENEHQKLHQEKNGIIKALEYAKEKTKTALQSVFSKFSGKSIAEALKERTELLNKPRGLEEIAKELNKQKEPQKSKGLDR